MGIDPTLTDTNLVIQSKRVADVADFPYPNHDIQSGWLGISPYFCAYRDFINGPMAESTSHLYLFVIFVKSRPFFVGKICETQRNCPKFLSRARICSAWWGALAMGRPQIQQIWSTHWIPIEFRFFTWKKLPLMEELWIFRKVNRVNQKLVSKNPPILFVVHPWVGSPHFRLRPDCAGAESPVARGSTQGAPVLAGYGANTISNWHHAASTIIITIIYNHQMSCMIIINYSYSYDLTSVFVSRQCCDNVYIYIYISLKKHWILYWEYEDQPQRLACWESPSQLGWLAKNGGVSSTGRSFFWSVANSCFLGDFQSTLR